MTSYRIGFDLCGTDAGKSGLSSEIRNFLAQFVAQAPHHEFHLVGLQEDFDAYVAGLYEDTPNVHFLSIKDFETYCREEGVVICEKYRMGKKSIITFLPNLLASNAIYVICNTQVDC